MGALEEEKVDQCTRGEELRKKLNRVVSENLRY